jgi:hypothetical protein
MPMKRLSRRIPARPALGHALGLLVLALMTPACSFNPSGLSNPDDLLPFHDDLAVVAPTSATRKLIYESPGLLSVFHGETCARANPSGSQETPLLVEEELPLPRDLDRGTVISNGYRLRYLDSDHHVKGLGTAIGEIVVNPGLLTWEAAGILSDHNFDDSFEWCYTYTAVAWNSQQLLAVVDDGDTGHAFRDRAWTHGTSLRPLAGFLFNKAFAGLEEVAVLPRGFAAMWADDHSTDHHLLQLAYNNDGGEVYVEGGKEYGNFTVASPTTSVGTGFVSWETTGFMKDNDLDRSQLILEVVTGLGGRDVGIINPPFTVAPREDSSFLSGCSGIPDGQVRTVETVVESVPFQFAIPVLAGWDLAYVCGDEHVTEIGAWLPNWEWQPGTSPAGGTLKYSVSSILRDKDGFPTFHSRTQVKILGFRPIAPGKR